MVISFVTDDAHVVSVCHVGNVKEGTRAQWQVLVQACGGGAGWGVPDLETPPTWSAERAAREALAWAQAQVFPPQCACNDPDCPGKRPAEGIDVFGPTDPEAVKLAGPYLTQKDAIMAAMVQAGMLDDETAVKVFGDEPTLEQLVAELDKPATKRKRLGRKPARPETPEPPDPHDGRTWRLG